QRFGRYTSYVHRAIGQLDIIDGNLEHLCSQFHEPQCDFFAGTADRVTGHYRGSAGPGPSTVRLQQGVPINDVYGIDLDRELVGDDLGQDGLDPLAQRGPSGVDSHPPAVSDLDVGRVVGAQAALFQKHRDSQADAATLVAGGVDFVKPAAFPCFTDCGVEQADVIAAVQDHVGAQCTHGTWMRKLLGR